MEKAIKNFFDQRRDAWLKNKIKASMDDEEKTQIEKAAEEKFSPANWLPDAAKRARQLSMVTHPPKLSHPSARTTPVIARNNFKNDGLLRTGNCKVDLDVYGNAAALDVYAFLSFELSDNQKVLDHIEQQTELIKKVFAVDAATFEKLRKGFLTVKESGEKNFTSERVKQVYFPYDDGYHLLSILTPSGLMSEVKIRLDEMRFSESAKAAREARKKGNHSESGYDDIFDLTVISFGGTKPQNISNLNSQNGGRAYLLPCLPPTFEKRPARLPTHDFFTDTLWINAYRESFDGLHKLFIIRDGYANMKIEAGVKHHIQSIVEQVVKTMWKVRQVDPGWSDRDNYTALPIYQKIWLDNNYAEQRESGDDEWLPQVIEAFSRWIMAAYRKYKKKEAVTLGSQEYTDRFKKIVTENREALR